MLLGGVFVFSPFFCGGRSGEMGDGERDRGRGLLVMGEIFMPLDHGLVWHLGFGLLFLFCVLLDAGKSRFIVSAYVSVRKKRLFSYHKTRP